MNTAMRNPEPREPLEVLGSRVERSDEILTTTACRLLTMLHRKFNLSRLALLAERRRRQGEIDAGAMPDFLASTADVRRSEWRVGPVPDDLRDRRVEITGPAERKMIINALNAPVQAFMADFEDSLSPTWANLVGGQVNLLDAVSGSMTHCDAASGKIYRLNQRTAVLHVRPRGWHLTEKHVLVDGEPVSGSLFDFAMFLANNHAAMARAGKRPYFYLPKLETHLEARLWNEVFVAAQQALGLPIGTIKATILIETLPAAFEMDEILYELRDHATALNCGRWDYIFSFIKVLRNHPQFVLPDRNALTMDRHFLQSYVNLLIKTCHRRGAHAIGGMAAQIPIKDDAGANEAAMNKVRIDKQREAETGHDGTWIAHPGLAEVAYQAFDLSRAPNQLHVRRSGVEVRAKDLLQVPPGEITEAGLRHNLRVGIQYVAAWLDGSGCVPLYHLMEDAATAEICRAQLWQWLRHSARTVEGETVTAEHVRTVVAEELAMLGARSGADELAARANAAAATLFTAMITSDVFDEFLTVPAYQLLESGQQSHHA